MSFASLTLSCTTCSFVSRSSAGGSVGASWSMPVGEGQRVAHPEAADEEVDVAPVRPVVKDHALGAVHGVEAFVGLVAAGDEEARRVAAGLPPAHEIDVGVAARERGMHAGAGVQEDRETAEQAHRNTCSPNSPARRRASASTSCSIPATMVSADSSIGRCAFPLR